MKGFKGLERPAVVLAVNGLYPDDDPERLLRVGVSRATHQVVVVAEAAALARLRRPCPQSIAGAGGWRPLGRHPLRASMHASRRWLARSSPGRGRRRCPRRLPVCLAEGDEPEVVPVVESADQRDRGLRRGLRRDCGHGPLRSSATTPCAEPGPVRSDCGARSSSMTVMSSSSSSATTSTSRCAWLPLRYVPLTPPCEGVRRTARLSLPATPRTARRTGYRPAPAVARPPSSPSACG